MPNYYPIMLDVRGRPAVVVGGNAVAAEKAAGLATSGAQVTLVAPTFSDEVTALAVRHAGQVTLRAKEFEPSDLDGAFVVVAATTYNPSLTETVATEAQRRNVLLNIVDVPARCNFILPSILRRDQLTIAVSTEGASPSIAKRIRQRLEAFFPPAYGPFLRLAASAREQLRAAGVSYAQRDDFFGDYLASKVLDRLEAGNHAGAHESIEALLGAYGVSVPHDAQKEEVAHADH